MNPQRSWLDGQFQMTVALDWSVLSASGVADRADCYTVNDGTLRPIRHLDRPKLHLFRVDANFLYKTFNQACTFTSAREIHCVPKKHLRHFRL